MRGAYVKEKLENACYYFSQQFKVITGKRITEPILKIFLLLFDVSGLLINLQVTLELNFKLRRNVLCEYPVEILDDINFEQLIRNSENIKFDRDYFSECEFRTMKKIIKYSENLMIDFEITYENDLENIK